MQIRYQLILLNEEKKKKNQLIYSTSKRHQCLILQDALHYISNYEEILFNAQIFLFDLDLIQKI